MATINPPYRFDPLQNVVKVKFGYKVVLADMFMAAAAQWKIEFSPGVAPDPPDPPHSLAPPDFGTPKNVLTETVNTDQIIEEDPTHFTILTGGLLAVSLPGIINMDWHGYTVVQNAHLQMNPHVDGVEDTWLSVLTPGSFIYYDPKGNVITADKVPAQIGNDKGLAIASDDDGTWHMSVDLGLRKFDSDGTQIASITPKPDTVFYESNTQLLRIVWITSAAPDAPSNGQGEIAHYDLGGSKQSFIIVGAEDDFEADDCSRKGRIYGRLAEIGETHEVFSVQAFDYDGSLLFTIPDMGTSGTSEFFTHVSAYGEDYIVALSLRTTSGSLGGGTTFSTVQKQYRVYDARTGAQVDLHDFVEQIGTSNSTVVIAEGVTTETVIRTINGYFDTQGLRRNNYFPQMNFTIPPS
jgi:hypothetical protein